MSEYSEEIKDEIRKAAMSCEWLRINALLQQYGPGLAAADLDGTGYTALHIMQYQMKDEMVDAAKSGEWSQINALLQQHGPELATVSLNKCSATVLHLIAGDAPDDQTSAESIRNLCTIYNVNVDFVHPECYWGWTPLHIATIYLNVHQVRALLRCGATVDTKDNIYDYTPMDNCCMITLFEGIDQTNKATIISLLKNPPRTYKQELIDKRNLLAMILNKLISLGTKDDIKTLLISIGY